MSEFITAKRNTVCRTQVFCSQQGLGGAGNLASILTEEEWTVLNVEVGG